MQASAIQRILGQDSSRKKREEKLSKQRAEIEEVVIVFLNPSRMCIAVTGFVWMFNLS